MRGVEAMAARKTVKPNMDKLHLYVSESGWSNAAFARKVGKHDRWLSEVARGRNFPSPEEAARMCVLLQTTPEEILSEEADIELVRGLLEQEREKGIKKGPILRDGAVSSAKQKLLDALDGLSDSQIEKLIGIIEEAKKLL